MLKTVEKMQLSRKILIVISKERTTKTYQTSIQTIPVSLN